MKAELTAAWAGALVSLAVCAAAGDDNDSLESVRMVHLASTAVPIVTNATAPVTPWIHPSMPSPVRDKLETAFSIAVERVNSVPECKELFTLLGVEATDTLKSVLYYPASPARETSVCRRSVAQTRVGGPRTWICRSVAAYPDDRVARVVIHEALHNAGLNEKPHDHRAMSSGDIDRLVKKRCGF